MKKRFIFILLCGLFLLTGCGKNSEKSVIKNLSKKINDADCYHIVGILDITNNDESYTYDVDVSYKKDSNYRVSLINKSNNHEQIILKNKDAVYVVTPSLNKSFKFQSDWPNNNSQIYLLKSILNDIEEDNKRTFEDKGQSFVFTTDVKYPNNNKLVKQNIKVDKNYMIKEVEVLDEDGVPQMVMKFKEIDLKANFDDKHFELDSITKAQDNDYDESSNDNNSSDDKTLNNAKPGDDEQNQTNSDEEEDSTKSSSLNDIVFPLYVPTGTSLTDQEKVSKTDGERVILTFDGEKPFLLVEETAAINSDFSIIPTYGEPFMMADTVAALTNNSLTWDSNGIEYYLVSDVLSQIELVEIANSISSIPTMK